LKRKGVDFKYYDSKKKTGGAKQAKPARGFKVPSSGAQMGDRLIAKRKTDGAGKGEENVISLNILWGT